MKFKNHLSISANKNITSRETFKSFVLYKKDIVKKNKNLSSRKAAQTTDIPSKIIKKNTDIFGSYLCELFSDCIKKGIFPDTLKHANITPVFKKGYMRPKENYRLVSTLPVISKIFKKFLFRKIYLFMDLVLFKYQCGFRKRFSALLAMLAKCKRTVDKENVFGVLLTDISHYCLT